MDKELNATENRPFWSKKMTGVLKATAIVLMFIHHFFSILSYIPETVNYSWAADFEKYFTAPTKSCVAIFAFITGYMYFFSKKKSLEHSLKSAGNLLVRYWVVAVPLLILGIVTGVYTFSVPHFVLELFGMENRIMIFAWYVYFYIFIMLFLPLLIKLTKDKIWVLVALTFVIFNFLFTPAYSSISDDLIAFKTIVSNCWSTLFPSVMGYAIAKSGLFFKIKKQTDKIPTVIRTLLFFVLMCASLMAPYLYYTDLLTLWKTGHIRFGFAINGYAFYVPVFIFCVVELFSFLEKTKAIRIFEILGKYSVYMWFWHCMFFGALGKYTKRILYTPRNPILVLLWGIAICLSLSVISDLVVKALALTKKKSAQPETAHPETSDADQEK